MDQTILRLLIREKLLDGRLPHDPVPRACGGPGQGETCDGCGETVTRAQLGMEDADAEHPIRFHVACFYVWDAERRALSFETGARLPARSALRRAEARPGRSWAPSAPPARPSRSA
jgi:hypothetical protein